MNDRLVLIHTVPPLIDAFNDLTREMLPGVDVKHILDEPLLEVVRLRGKLADGDAGRLKDHVLFAEAIGARAVLVTCSTISPLVDLIRPTVTVRVEKIDEAMITEAVKGGGRIGILVTNPTTLAPTRLLVDKQARRTATKAEVVDIFVPEAFDLLLAGNGADHDRLVLEAIASFSPKVDRIILAQASLARVLAALPENRRPVPILSSPHLALARIRAYLTYQFPQ